MTVKDPYGKSVGWVAGDILYLLATKTLSNGLIQPQIVSDTQIKQADYSLYSDIKFLNDNPQYKIAVGKALSDTTMALGISADVDTYYSAQDVYEVAWDGNFNASVRFGDGQFGNIPAQGAAVKIIYRINNTNTY